MISLLWFAVALAKDVEPAQPAPCMPMAVTSDSSTPSAMGDHRALREAIGEPMPQAPTMVMVYGKGGHLATNEYSIIAVRSVDGVWRGTAVGRSQIWIKDAPFRPMPRAEWALDGKTGKQLDYAISHYCTARSAPHLPSGEVKPPPPPPLGTIFERIDIVAPGRTPSTFSADQGSSAIAALVRPPSLH
jgi:hypothetical protein